jgi:TetR/AcrR family transcriptional regulator, tetracycline repressor protein
VYYRGSTLSTGVAMTSTSSRRRRGPHRVFTQAEVLDAAQQLLDAGGPEAASVRAIAKKLGVAPNTIYTYYPDKAALDHALVERLLGEVDHGVFADDQRPWRQRVEAVALELREQLASHPSAVGLIVGDPLSGPHALALNERTRQLFTDAGLDPADAVRATHVLIVYILGSMALEIAHPGDQALPADHETATHPYLWGLHRVLDGLTANTHT